MCHICETSVGGTVRPCPATDMELAMLAKARRTTDPKKLSAMLPAWLKKAIFKAPKPFVFIPGQPPVLPNFATRALPLNPHIPSTDHVEAGLIAYIQAFENGNHLKATA